MSENWQAVKRKDGRWAVEKPLGPHGCEELAKGLDEKTARFLAATHERLEALRGGQVMTHTPETIDQRIKATIWESNAQRIDELEDAISASDDHLQRVEDINAELLEVLKELLRFAGTSQLEASNRQGTSRAKMLARAAIAKAEGK